jgi:hypothetical protein
LIDDRILRLTAVAERLANDRLHHRQDILHPVDELVIEKLLMCLRLLAFRDVDERADWAFDPAFSDDRTSPILDRKTRPVSPIEYFVDHMSVGSSLRGFEHSTM